MKLKWLTVLLLAIAYIAPNKCKVVDKGVQSQSKENSSAIKIEEEVSAPKFKFPTKLYKMVLKPAGNSVRIKCIAKGNPTPNITWYKNKKTPITRSFFAPSYGKWSLVLDELIKEDDGNYTCVICNQLGCIDHTTVLKIQERYASKPYIKEGYPGNITALVNETVTFACPPISDLEPYLYWIRPRQNPMEYNFEEIPKILKSENPEDKPEQLTIYKVTKKDEGWYVCVALNSLGQTKAKGFLSVLESLPSSEAPNQAKQEQPTS